MLTRVVGGYRGDKHNRIFIENGRHHGRKTVAHLTEGRAVAAAVETGVEA